MDVAYATNSTAATVYHSVVTRNETLNAGRPEVVVEQSMTVVSRRGLRPDASGSLWVHFDDGSKLLWSANEGFGHSRNNHFRDRATS